MTCNNWFDHEPVNGQVQLSKKKNEKSLKKKKF